MKGFNQEKLPERNLADVTPLRFNVLVKLTPETPVVSGGIILPDNLKIEKNSTRAQLGLVIAIGDRVKDSQIAEGLVNTGKIIIFDESISIDDPNRCFTFEGDTYVLFDLSSVQAVFDKDGNLDLLADRYLVERPEKKEKTLKSGLHIPIVCVAEPVGGVVVESGKGAFAFDGRRLPMSVKVGQEVLYPKFGGSDIRLEGKEYVIILQEKILAVVAKGTVKNVSLVEA